MTPLGDQRDDYLRIRRALGYKLARTEKLLVQFISFLEERGERVITTENTLAWVTLPGGSDSWRAHRLSAVRGFAAYLHALDDAHQVPPADLCPNRPARATPYLYSEHEIAALMAATVILRGRLRQATYRTLIGLLAVTGIRPAEALALDRQDVDLRHGVLHVRAGKQHKQREVPLHHSTVSALRQYARLRDARFPAPSTPAFFIGARGRRMGRGELNQTFTTLVRQAGLDGRGARARPRPYDLRHAFAVRTLLDWHRAGADIDRRMPLLSTYLGHADPASTYWYLEAVPELLELISRRLEQLPGALS